MVTSPKQAGVHQQPEERSEAPSISSTVLQPRAPPALTGRTKSSSLIRALTSKTRAPGDPSERSGTPQHIYPLKSLTTMHCAPLEGIAAFLTDACPSKGTCGWKRVIPFLVGCPGSDSKNQNQRQQKSRPCSTFIRGRVSTRDQEVADFQVFIFQYQHHQAALTPPYCDCLFLYFTPCVLLAPSSRRGFM